MKIILKETNEFNKMFSNFNATLRFRGNEIKSFKRFEDLYQFVQSEHYFWVEYSYLNNFSTVKKYRELKYALDKIKQKIRYEYIDSIVKHAEDVITVAIGKFNLINAENITRDSSQAELIKKLASQSTPLLIGAIDFFMNKSLPNGEVQKNGFFIALTNEYPLNNDKIVENMRIEYDLLIDSLKEEIAINSSNFIELSNKMKENQIAAENIVSEHKMKFNDFLSREEDVITLFKESNKNDFEALKILYSEKLVE
ncbi:MAG: hypothetical protein OIF36_03150 [Alphaproteobacteria bacterium]|nr:hypothetical protein [Alphaproteobacteria bacterium]